MADRLHHRLAALALAALASSASAADFWHHSDLGNILTPDQAFQLQPVEAHGKTLHVEWDIAPGYYMYLNRLKFQSTEPGVELGAPKLPAGEKITDEHFGDVVIQRGGHLLAEIPVNAVPKTVQLTYQGCAEAGVCLPPQTRRVEVQPVP